MTREGTTVVLDIQPVEPKDRYETIMGTYDSLRVGDVLELTVDHDPLCMYYTLCAEQGETSFSFEYVERGPERWRVLVGKLGNVEASSAAADGSGSAAAPESGCCASVEPRSATTALN